MMPPRTILVIDSEESIRDLLCEYFEKLGYRTYAAEGIPEGAAVLASTAVSVAVVDVGPRNLSEIEEVERLRSRQPGLPVVLTSACPTMDALVSALRHKIADFIVKPFRLQEIGEAVERASAVPVDEQRIRGLHAKVLMLEALLRSHAIPLPDDAQASSGDVEDQTERSRDARWE
jgi:DNA-binding NtrC family response regulator